MKDITFHLTTNGSNSYECVCPLVDLSAKGKTEQEAISKCKSLVAEYLKTILRSFDLQDNLKDNQAIAELLPELLTGNIEDDDELSDIEPVKPLNSNELTEISELLENRRDDELFEIPEIPLTGKWLEKGERSRQGVATRKINEVLKKGCGEDSFFIYDRYCLARDGTITNVKSGRPLLPKVYGGNAYIRYSQVNKEEQKGTKERYTYHNFCINDELLTYFGEEAKKDFETKLRIQTNVPNVIVTNQKVENEQVSEPHPI